MASRGKAKAVVTLPSTGYETSEERLRRMNTLIRRVSYARASKDPRKALGRVIKDLENAGWTGLTDDQWTKVFMVILRAEIANRDRTGSLRSELSFAVWHRARGEQMVQIIQLLDFSKTFCDAAWKAGSFELSANLFSQSMNALNCALNGYLHHWETFPTDVRRDLGDMISRMRIEFLQVFKLKNKETPHVRLWYSIPLDLRRGLRQVIAERYPNDYGTKSSFSSHSTPGHQLMLRQAARDDFDRGAVNREDIPHILPDFPDRYFLRTVFVVPDSTDRQILRIAGEDLIRELNVRPKRKSDENILDRESRLDWCLRVLGDKSVEHLLRRLYARYFSDTRPSTEDIVQLAALESRIGAIFDGKIDSHLYLALSSLCSHFERRKKPEKAEESEQDDCGSTGAVHASSGGGSQSLALRTEVRLIQTLSLSLDTVFEQTEIPLSLATKRSSRFALQKQDARIRERIARQEKLLSAGPFFGDDAEHYRDIAVNLLREHGILDPSPFLNGAGAVPGTVILANLSNYQAHAAEDELLAHARQALPQISLRTRGGQITTVDADTVVLARYKGGKWEINEGGLFNPSSIDLSSLFSSTGKEKARALAELRVRSYALKRFLLQQIGDSYPGAAYVEYGDPKGQVVRIMYAPAKVGDRNIVFSFHLHPDSYSLSNFERIEGVNWLPNVRTAAPDIARWFSFYFYERGSQGIADPNISLRKWESAQRKLRSSKRR